MKYYTYIYYDPSRLNEPIYVGKGCNERAWQHLKSKRKSPFIQRLQFMKKNGVTPIIGIYSDIDEELSLLIEEELILKFGRKDLGKGPLLNLTDGGEGTSGFKWSSESRKAHSMNRSGSKNPMYKIKHSDNSKKKIGSSQPSSRNYTKEVSEFMSERQKGEKNPMYGKLPKNTIPFIYNGVSFESIKAAAKANNVPYVTFWKRIKKEQE